MVETQPAQGTVTAGVGEVSEDTRVTRSVVVADTPEHTPANVPKLCEQRRLLRDPDPVLLNDRDPVAVGPDPERVAPDRRARDVDVERGPPLVDNASRAGPGPGRGLTAHDARTVGPCVRHGVHPIGGFHPAANAVLAQPLSFFGSNPGGGNSPPHPQW